jgi:hypothetical protein
MNRQDTATRRTAFAIVVGVGLFAGGDSYTHIYDLAREHHQDAISAALLPLAGDGLVFAASSAIMAAARNGTDIPARVRVFFYGGILATVAANLAYGLPGGRTEALLAVWPVLAYVGCMEILAWMREHLGASKKARTAPASASGTQQTASETPKTDAPEDELRDRRERRPVPDLIAAAEVAFPGGMNTGKGKPASLRDT